MFEDSNYSFQDYESCFLNPELENSFGILKRVRKRRKLRFQ